MILNSKPSPAEPRVSTTPSSIDELNSPRQGLLMTSNSPKHCAGAFHSFHSAPVSAPRCDAFSWPSDKSWRTASRTMSLRRAARGDLSKVDVSLRDTNRSRHGVSGLLSLAGRLRASSSYRLNFARSNRLGRNAAYLYETRNANHHDRHQEDDALPSLGVPPHSLKSFRASNEG